MKASLIAFFFGLPALAMSDGEYQMRTTSLNHQQKETEAVMRRLGAGTGFSMPSPTLLGNASSQDTKRRPLFQIHADLSTVRIPTGKLLYGRTLNRLVVGPEGSPALITLDSDQGLLSDLRIMGVAKQGSTEGRITLELNRLLLRNGKVVSILGAGLDPSGAFGIESQVFSGKAVEVAGSLASSFISGFAASQQTQSVNTLGFSTTQPGGRNALLQGVAQSAADQAKRLIQESTAEKPILVLEALTPIAILVQEEVRF